MRRSRTNCKRGRREKEIGRRGAKTLVRIRRKRKIGVRSIRESWCRKEMKEENQERRSGLIGRRVRRRSTKRWDPGSQWMNHRAGSRAQTNPRQNQ